MNSDRAYWWFAGYGENGQTLVDLSKGTPRQLIEVIDATSRAIEQCKREQLPTDTDEELLRLFREELAKRADR